MVKWEHKKTDTVDERITHSTVHIYELLQTSVILGYINFVYVMKLFSHFAINTKSHSLCPSFLSHHGCVCIKTVGN